MKSSKATVKKRTTKRTVARSPMGEKMAALEAKYPLPRYALLQDLDESTEGHKRIFQELQNSRAELHAVKAELARLQAQIRDGQLVPRKNIGCVVDLDATLATVKTILSMDSLQQDPALLSVLIQHALAPHMNKLWGRETDR